VLLLPGSGQLDKEATRGGVDAGRFRQAQRGIVDNSCISRPRRLQHFVYPEL